MRLVSEKPNPKHGKNNETSNDNMHGPSPIPGANNSISSDTSELKSNLHTFISNLLSILCSSSQIKIECKSAKENE